jgi:cellobiose-specific phosphotransferase system component IIA
MTLQYARLFQLRAGISLIAENGGMTREELAEALRQRKSFDAANEDAMEAGEDIITHLQEAHLITDDAKGYRLTTQDDLASAVDNPVLLYPGDAVPGAGEERAQADRILTNVMSEHPMLVVLAKYIYRHGPVKHYEVKREFDGEDFLGDKMNSFTIDMGLDLLDDAGVIEEGASGFTKGRWPVRLFAHVVHEEYFDLGGDHGGGVREPDLFERLETLYGIDRSTFDTMLSRLHAEGIVSEASYEELILNPDTLTGANIHE